MNARVVRQVYPRSDLNLTELPDLERVKRKNIIEMGLGFTAMIRIFAQGSKAKIAAKLEELFSGLAEIHSREDYEGRHRSFCDWFTREIRTAEKTTKKGKVHPSQPSSYGQAAKVLDIAIKVYVYYCAQPSAEISQQIVPLLNGAVDIPIMNYLKTKYPTATIRATTINEVDETAYLAIQSLVLKESGDCKMHPVQYDDMKWRQLNRDRNAPNRALHRTRQKAARR